MELFLDAGPTSEAITTLLKYTRCSAVTPISISAAAQAHLQFPNLPCLISPHGVFQYPISILNYITQLSKTEVLQGSTVTLKGQVTSLIDLITQMNTNDLVEWLDGYLLHRTFLVGNHITLADVVAYYHVLRTLLTLDIDEKYKVINVYRWANHIQSLPMLKDIITRKISMPPRNNAKIQKKKETAAPAAPAAPKEEKKEAAAPQAPAKQTVAPAAKKPAAEEKKKQQPNKKKQQAQKKQGKQGNPQKAPQQKKVLPSPGAHLDIRVGKITKIWLHESDPHLYCEEIDFGGEVRQAVSGIADKVPMEQMDGAFVVCLCNLKPRPVKGFNSTAMIFCAEHGETIEPLVAPANSQPGDKVSIADHPQVECAQLPGKKWENAKNKLAVGPERSACYENCSWSTDKGPITVPSLTEGLIK